MSFIIEKLTVLTNELSKMRVEQYCDITDITYLPCDYKENSPVPPITDFKPFADGIKVLGEDAHFWFHMNFKTPVKKNNTQVNFHLETSVKDRRDGTNPQSLVYLNGIMVQGLDIHHHDVLLEFDTEYDVYIYFYVGMTKARLDFLPSIELIDTKTEKIFYDLSVPLNAALCLKEDTDNRNKILKCLELAANIIDMRVPKSNDYYKSIDEALDFLDKEFYHGLCKDNDVKVYCIGHTHIDVAWLWTLEQTKDKAQRSFSTVLNLLKQYPEYKFMSSQPQLYSYVKKYAPELYSEIKKAVKDGRWEVEGGMWLEADCNLTSGESLIRQILLGKKFIKNEFDIDSKTLWLPDVFGYSAALPQILKKCGMENFVTSKISWNETNTLPYDTFMWQGIDGTEIFTNFITCQDCCENDEPKNLTTYVGYIRPSQIYGTWKRYHQKQYNTVTIETFGFGDGGGGPTKDMLEQQRRLSRGIPGIPQTEIKFTSDYLSDVRKNFDESCKKLKTMPKWVGELYLELHRGTYTSIGKNKRNNRKSEFLCQRAETISIMDSVLLGGTYQFDALDECWHSILLHQFHDIIPGSSIYEVYEESDKAYSKIISAGNQIMTEKLKNISSNINTSGGILVYNPNAFTVSAPVKLNGKTIFVKDIPALGYKVTEAKENAENIKITNSSLENNFFVIEFNQKGSIASIFDKVNKREIVISGKNANELQVFEDLPKSYDAWEISDYYKSKMWVIDNVVSVKQLHDGVRGGLEITWKFLSSEIRQCIYIYDDVPVIDFETIVDWKETHMLLKSAFPVDVHVSEATYDVQFGYVKRPTHQNTSWDAAKFEVCAQKWADISDGSYGVSLMNDCKYGYSAEGSTLKLSLIKCATYPNPNADKEIHHFTYSLYPHSGDFKQAKTLKQSYILNKPLYAAKIGAQQGKLCDNYSLVCCEENNIIIDTVKKAECSDDVIVRFYESNDMRTDAHIKLGFDFSEVYLCDMLENNIEKLEAVNGTISVPTKNFEIITLKIAL